MYTKVDLSGKIAERFVVWRYVFFVIVVNLIRCKMADGGGHWGVPNTAIPQKNSANTAIPQKKSLNTATPQYRVETRCNPENGTLYVKVSANNTDITITSFFTNTGMVSQVVFNLDKINETCDIH